MPIIIFQEKLYKDKKYSAYDRNILFFKMWISPLKQSSSIQFTLHIPKNMQLDKVNKLDMYFNKKTENYY